MAELTLEGGANEADAEVGAAGDRPQASRRRPVTLIAAALALAVTGGGAGWWWMGHRAAPPEAELPTAEELVDIPAISTNLRTADGGSRGLRIHLMLVPGAMAKQEVEARQPMLVDRFLPLLRELRPEDISGSASLFRIREELLVLANGLLGEGAVKDVLVEELVQQ